MLLYKCCSWVGGDLSNSGNEMSECFRAIIAGGRRRGTHLDQDTEKAIWIFKIIIITVFATFHAIFSEWCNGNSIAAAAVAVVKVNKLATVKKLRELLWMYNTND